MPFSLYFATQNAHKVQEAQSILGNKRPILSLKGLHSAPLREPYASLQENAAAKATYIAARYQVSCFAEDTGLFVEALKGAPGVHTARYAGPDASDEQNCQKLLSALHAITTRKAYFCSYIALCHQGTLSFFKGYCYGSIATRPQGQTGFGYDPIFLPQNHTKSFAQMTSQAKNQHSHRRYALEALSQHLQSL